jgi:DNA-binding CsgD family transcriptional regulator/uncharacterized membrane protein YqjE
VAILLPVFSMFLMINSERIPASVDTEQGKQSEKNERFAERRQRPLPIRLVASLGLYGIALGFVTEMVVIAFPIYSQVSLSAFSSVLLLLLVTAVFNVWSNRGSLFQMAHYALLPMIATALLVTVVPLISETMLVVAILNVAIFVLGEIYFWSILAAQSRLRGQNSFRVFGIGQSAKVLGLVSGMFLVYMIQDKPSEVTSTTVAIVLYLLVFAALLTNNPITLSFTESQLVSILEQSQTQSHAPCEGETVTLTIEDAIRRKCLLLAKKHELSNREEEVLEKLVSGYKLRAIAEELSISESTAKAHTKHIYQKLGLHSRQDLVSFFRFGSF